MLFNILFQLSPELVSFLDEGGSEDRTCERCLAMKDDSIPNVLSKPGLPWVAHPIKLKVPASSNSFKLTCFVSISRLEPELFVIKNDGRIFQVR
jgi:hypothetical protein